ncbi:unnamed protein product [Caenorhabditis angaria]|uniref:Glycosyltransferase family 92 protein n=1 Tax=Caenorhabditis angaria TaxID=860376 RepID=A0A9P1IUW6_9PELO|nr:unnamed protein product [Caenorhabditis angaria]
MVSISQRIHRLPRIQKYALLFIFLFTAIYWMSGDSVNKIYVPLRTDTHTFIHSAYYYEDSKSLGKNAIAIVTTMDKRFVSELSDYTINVIGSNSSDQMMTKATLTSEHYIRDKCEYMQVLAQTNTVDNLEKLEIEANGVKTLIPIKKPKKKAPQSVVFCISPQFAAEQWQTFLMQVHVAKKYGAHLHIYIVSMVDSYFELLREYEKLGLVTLEPWLTIRFAQTMGEYLEPNSHVELRNQAAAHTDCLLMYKEAADFVGALDMDDILIPNVGSYHEFFTREYDGDYKLAAINFRKHDYEVIKVGNPAETTISAILRSAKKLETADTGKSFFYPDRYNSTWHHFSRVALGVVQYHPENQAEPYKTHVKWNWSGIFHLRTMIQVGTEVLPEIEKKPIPMMPWSDKIHYISEYDLQDIDRDLKNTLSLPQIAPIAARLPREEFYMPIVFQCYNQSFYHARSLKQLDQQHTCINAFDCELPQRKDLPCYHSSADYQSGPAMIPITFHWANNATFTKDIGCYQ